MTEADNESPDQLAHQCSLIRISLSAIELLDTVKLVDE